MSVASRPWMVLMLLALLLPGCISRKLFVRSEPAGATVILDGRPVGTTPYEEELPAYGTRRLVLELPGYERLERDLPLPTPWYEYWPLDMVTDLLLPFTVEDHRHFSFVLAERQPAADDWAAAEAEWKRAKAARPEPPADEEEP